MANVLLSTKAVGSTVKLTVNGKAREFIVVHQGKPSSVYDESCNGTWLLKKDIYENRVWQSGNINKYESSDIHSYLNNTFLKLFDSNIQGAIKQVKLPYRKNGGSGGTTQQGANGLPCKIFLLSAPEVHYEHSYIDSGEGAALSYFASCVTNGADSKRVAYLNGSAASWWLRSPLANGTSQPATESLVATLKGTVRDTGLDLDKMSEAAIHFRKVAEQLKASGALDPKVLNVDTNTLLYQVPGGMLSNLISQLKQAGKEDKYYDVLAEIPRVREDFGYPPLVTPSSQIVGTQAVMNIIFGERYKNFPKESRAMLRGEYGKLPGTVNEEVRAKAGIKPEDVITCRPADLLEPELPKYREEFKDLARSEEDVLSLALFPQVAPAFINRRNLRTPKEHRTMAPIAHSAKHERAVAPFSRK